LKINLKRKPLFLSNYLLEQNNQESEIRNEISQHAVPPKRDRLKEVLEKEIKPKEKDSECKKAVEPNEIIIEDNSTKKETKVAQQQKSKAQNYNNNAQINNMDPSKINEAKEKIKNMVI
jgi:hypothetical protein